MPRRIFGAMIFTDRLTLDAPRKVADGYLIARARAARCGTYEYLGREIDPDNKHGLRDKGIVKVLRDEATVFDERSVRSFIGKPITDDHPAEAVTADNWKRHARGTVMGAMRDGEYLAFDLLLTDAEAIRKIDGGKRELSNGYSAELAFGDFIAPDGSKCVARQARITGNHVALVDQGRAGPQCRIADAATCEGIPVALFDALVQRTYSAADESHIVPPTHSNPDGVTQVATKTITFDGLPLEVTDAAEAAINKIKAQLADAISGKETAEMQVATLTTDKQALEAKVATLEQQVADSTLSPAQLRDAAKAYALTVDKAKVLGIEVTDAMDEAEIRKAAVSAKLGDAVKDWTDAMITASFDTLTKDAKPADKVAAAIRDSKPVVHLDHAVVSQITRTARYN